MRASIRLPCLLSRCTLTTPASRDGGGCSSACAFTPWNNAYRLLAVCPIFIPLLVSGMRTTAAGGGRLFPSRFAAPPTRLPWQMASAHVRRGCLNLSRHSDGGASVAAWEPGHHFAPSPAGRLLPRVPCLVFKTAVYRMLPRYVAGRKIVTAAGTRAPDISCHDLALVSAYLAHNINVYGFIFCFKQTWTADDIMSLPFLTQTNVTPHLSGGMVAYLARRASLRFIT